jgi:hypothetical protein
MRAAKTVEEFASSWGGELDTGPVLREFLKTSGHGTQKRPGSDRKNT